jgi:hypothetical protein
MVIASDDGKVTVLVNTTAEPPTGRRRAVQH